MIEIPISAVPNQSLTIILDGNICQININTRDSGYGNFLTFTIAVQNTPITTNTICLNLVKLVKQNYLGFTQNFVFFDTQGNSDPDYTGLGSRYLLLYLSEEESAQL